MTNSVDFSSVDLHGVDSHGVDVSKVDVSEIDVSKVDFDHHSAACNADPVTYYQSFRERCPVGRTPAQGGFVYTTRYAEVVRIARDDETFSSSRRATGVDRVAIVIPSGPGLEQYPIELDPPEATGYRDLINPLLTPDAVERLRPMIARHTTRVVDGFIERGSADFVRDLTNPLPAAVTLDWLGFPEEDWARLAGPIHDIFAAPADSERARRGAEGLAHMEQRIRELVRLRRAEPARDAVSHLAAQTRPDGTPYAEEELVSVIGLLIAGGVDTTTSLTGSVLVHLSRHPEQRRRLIDSPDLLDIATEEFLRAFAPSQSMARTARADTQVGGCPVRAGERVLIPWVAANHDPAVFPEPAEVRLDRDATRHLSFGIGTHRCAGAHLARAMFREMITQVLTRLPEFRVTEEELVAYPTRGNQSGWDAIPAVFPPAPRLTAPTAMPTDLPGAQPADPLSVLPTDPLSVLPTDPLGVRPAGLPGVQSADLAAGPSGVQPVDLHGVRPAGLPGVQPADLAAGLHGVQPPGLPGVEPAGPSGALPQLFEAVVTDVVMVADDVLSLTLARDGGGELPAWEPGAHLELRLPSGRVRQYSLCGDPGDRRHYRVAVLREPHGRGGSAELHELAQAGVTIPVKGPRNHFPLVPGEDYLFLAGGIGVTPILAMVRAAARRAMPLRVVYGGRSRASMAFAGELLALAGDRAELLPQDESGLPDLDAILSGVTPATAIYCCGPAAMIEAVERACARAGVEDRLYVERFTAGDALEVVFDPARNTEFEVRLARSERTMRVPAGRRLIEVVREAVPGLSYDCEKGYCGACETRVLAGTPEHRDSLLTAEERKTGRTMMICVSRAASPQLVLDL